MGRTLALAAVPARLYAMSICATIVVDGGPGYLNVLVILVLWNAVKFASIAVASPFLYARRVRAWRRPSAGTWNSLSNKLK